VALAACVDVSGISPGNNKGDCEVPEAEPVAPPVPPADPAGGDCDVAPDCDAVEGDETDGEEGVGPPSASDPTAFSLLFALLFALPFAWPFSCSAVWPCAVAIPISIVAMMKMSFIAISCVIAPKRHVLPHKRTTPDPQKMKMKFTKGTAGKPVAPRDQQGRIRAAGV